MPYIKFYFMILLTENFRFDIFIHNKKELQEFIKVRPSNVVIVV